MKACGVSAVVGAHSHLASRGIEAPQGGEYQMTFSLGNFLFDQRGPRSSSALVELRVFELGTFATRLIPAPNLYELAATLMHRLKDDISIINRCIRSRAGTHGWNNFTIIATERKIDIEE